MLYIREHLIPNSMNSKIQQYNYLTFLNTLKILNYLANTEKNNLSVHFYNVCIYSQGELPQRIYSNKNFQSVLLF